MEAREVIVQPLLTEKGTLLKDTQNQYIFSVHPEANKIQVKQAIELIFDVKVRKVATMNRLGKMRRLRQRAGRRPSWKRAVVSLEAGHELELFEGV